MRISIKSLCNLLPGCFLLFLLSRALMYPLASEVCCHPSTTNRSSQPDITVLAPNSVIYCKLFTRVGVVCEQLLWRSRGWMMFRGCAAAYVQCMQPNAPSSTSRSSVPIWCVESAEKSVSYWPFGFIHVPETLHTMYHSRITFLHILLFIVIQMVVLYVLGFVKQCSSSTLLNIVR